MAEDLLSWFPPEQWVAVAPFLLLTPNDLCHYRITCRTAHFGTTKLVTDRPPFAGFNVMNCVQDCLPAYIHWIIQGMRRLRPTWRVRIKYSPCYGSKNKTRITRRYVYIEVAFDMMGGNNTKFKSVNTLQICRLTGLIRYTDNSTVFRQRRNVALDCVEQIENGGVLPCRPKEKGVPDEEDSGAIRLGHWSHTFHTLDYYKYYERQALQTKNKDEKKGYHYLFKDKKDGGIDLDLSLADIRARLLAFSSNKQEVFETKKKKKTTVVVV